MSNRIAALAESIAELGRELVACHRACEGVACKQSIGQLPRCLFLETAGRLAGRGTVVVGLNPGRSSHAEQRYYLERGCSYDAVVSWHHDRGLRHPYYKHLRRFVDSVGLTGPILWTELAKCENGPGASGLLPLQTFRTCTAAFLERELAVVPEDWLLLGVGSEAFKALAYRFPARTLIGVPHPTGSRGHFHELFTGSALAAYPMEQSLVALSRDGSATWLSNSG